MKTLLEAAMQLAHDSMDEALAEVVRQLGGAKRVGATLWPEKELGDAGRLLRHCIDPERPEKLSIEQLLLLLRLGREARCHAAAVYLLRASGYQDPVPLSPEDERAALQRDFVAQVSALQKLVKRMDGAGVPLRAVGGAE